MNDKIKQLMVEIEALETALDLALSVPEADYLVKCILKKKAALRKEENKQDGCS